MKALIRNIENVSEWTGQLVSWLTFLMVLVTFIVVILRYAFDMGWIWLQESVIWMHALVLLIGAAYTLKHEEHVRVDVLYQRMTPKKKAWVNIIGTVLLLIPTTVFLFFSAWDFVAESWRVKEQSREAGGLPAIYLLKATIPIMAVLVFLQGLALLMRSISTVRNPNSVDPIPKNNH